MSTFFLSKNMLVFLFFLVISTIFWLIISLNNTFEVRIAFPIEYKNAPNDLLISGTLPQTLDVKVKEKGTIILSYENAVFKPLIIDFKDYPRFVNTRHISISSDRFERTIRKQLQSSTIITDIYPETIEINDIDFASKEVPVHFMSDVECKNNYYVCSTPYVTPESITIYGDASAIDSIKYVKTNTIKARNLQSSYNGKVCLALPKHVRTDIDSVDYVIPVAETVELSIMVPVKVCNVPKGLNVKTIPSEVEVIYQKGMNNKRQFTADDFIISIDYENIIESNSQEQKEPLTLDYHTDEAWNVRHKTKSVYWVIEVGAK